MGLKRARYKYKCHKQISRKPRVFKPEPKVYKYKDQVISQKEKKNYQVGDYYLSTIKGKNKKEICSMALYIENIFTDTLYLVW